MEADPARQRLFAHPAGHCILLHKDGVAVQFQVDARQRVRVVRRLTGVDFAATGRGLKAGGWRCVGPGLEFSWVLDSAASERMPPPAD
jgi:hypothetical protein